MLNFYGIAAQGQGEPKRYQYKPDLKGMLHVFLVIFDHCQGQKLKVFQSIEAALTEHLSQADPMQRAKTTFRATTAKWLRTRDLANFFFQDPISLPLKLQIARILDEPCELQAKWGRIFPRLLSALEGADPALAAEQLGDAQSEFRLLVEWIALHFLEQDPEPPPPNLTLELARGNYPQSLWRQRDKLYHNANPFWQPQNPLCRGEFLAQQILLYLARPKQSLEVAETAEQQHLLADHEADHLSMQLPEAEGTSEPLIPENLTETLLRLQTLVQARIPREGVRHFFALLRQLSEQKELLASFEMSVHFKLLGLDNKSEARRLKAEEELLRLFELLSQVKVKRKYHASEQMRERVRPFLSLLSQERIGLSSLSSRFELNLDPLFKPRRGASLCLGGHLAWVPVEAFAESPTKHALLLPLLSFVTGSWLIEYPQRRGVLRMKGEDLLQGSAIRVTPQGKKNLLHKLDQTLNYMEKRNYIQKMRKQAAANQNPWEEEYSFSAPPELLASLQDSLNQSRLVHA